MKAIDVVKYLSPDSPLQKFFQNVVIFFLIDRLVKVNGKNLNMFFCC